VMFAHFSDFLALLRFRGETNPTASNLPEGASRGA